MKVKELLKILEAVDDDVEIMMDSSHDDVYGPEKIDIAERPSFLNNNKLIFTSYDHGQFNNQRKIKCQTK